MNRKTNVIFLFLILVFSKGIAQKINADSLDRILNSKQQDTLKAKALLLISDQILYAHPDSSFMLAKQATNYLAKDSSFNMLYWAHRNLGYYYQNTFQPDSARKHFYNSLRYAKKLGIKRYEAQCLGSIGNTYTHEEKFSEALKYFHLALKTFEEIGNKRGEGISHAVIGNVYTHLEQNENALQSYNKARNIFKELNLEHDWAMTLMNIGSIYQKEDEYTKALQHLLKSTEVFRKIDSKVGLGQSLALIGKCYLKIGEFEKSIQFQKEALELIEYCNSIKDVIIGYMDMGLAYDSLKKFNKAIEYYEKALKHNEKMEFVEQEYHVTKRLYLLHKKSGNFQKSLQFLEQNVILNDTMNKRHNHEILDEYLVKYEIDNKNKEIKLLQKEQEIKEFKIYQKNLVIGSIIIILALSFIFILMQYRSISKKNKTNILLESQKEKILEQKEYIVEQNNELKQQKAEIEAQREEIEIQRDYVVEQRDQISKKNNQINDSISYASSIQNGVLQPDKLKGIIEQNHFVYHKPKDVVSGDFYWAKKIENKTVIAIADCTGHGVPGAFMSLMGIAFLNNIIGRNNKLKPSEILTELKNELMLSLKTPDNGEYPIDGMDIAILIKEENNIKYAGVNIPLLLCKENEVTTISPFKSPVGIYHYPSSAECLDIELDEGTKIYLLSDGFIDQFGGSNNRKYGNSRFKKFLAEISEQPMHKQKLLINEELIKWKNSNEQIDDILIFGLHV